MIEITTYQINLPRHLETWLTEKSIWPRPSKAEMEALIGRAVAEAYEAEQRDKATYIPPVADMTDTELAYYNTFLLTAKNQAEAWRQSEAAIVEKAIQDKETALACAA